MKKAVYFLFVFNILITSCKKNKAQKQDTVPLQKEKDTILQKGKEKNITELIFTVQVGAYKNANQKLTSISDVQVTKEASLYKYRLGVFKEYHQARDYRKSLLSKYPDAFVQALKKNRAIGITEALK